MDRWIRIGRAFSPWAVALSVPRALPWAGIGARRWRLRPSARCGFLGASQLRVFLKLTHYQKPHLFCRIGRAFSPWAVALSVPRALPWAGMGARRWRLSIGRAFSPWAVALSAPRALPWAGIGARRWRLTPSARCELLGSVTTSASFLKSAPFALGWYRSAPLALEAIRRVWIVGERHNFGFYSNLHPLPWAGIGVRRWRLRPSRWVWIFGDRHNFGFSQTDSLP